MTPITEANTFDPAVNMYELTDPVLGGETGESNDPIIALANRSRFLYNYQFSFTDIAVITASATINNTYLRKLIYINGTGNLTLTLSALSGFLTGQTLHFKCKNVAGKCVAIIPTGGEVIADGAVAKSIWLYDGEQISLTKVSGAGWEITFCKGNFDIAGNDGMVRKQPRNAAVADGSMVSRADYARLFNEISTNAISDFTWLSDPVSYRGLFSLGDGATTFRLPDLRSMQWRGLDLGRNISLTRITGGSLPGGYSPDEVKAHIHGFPIGDGAQPGPPGFIPDMNPLDGNIKKVTGATELNGNSTETVGKNIGLIPVIYF